MAAKLGGFWVKWTTNEGENRELYCPNKRAVNAALDYLRVNKINTCEVTADEDNLAEVVNAQSNQ